MGSKVVPSILVVVFLAFLFVSVSDAQKFKKYPGGTQAKPEGSQAKPEGSQTKQDGSQAKSDGSQTKPQDGSGSRNVPGSTDGVGLVKRAPSYKQPKATSVDPALKDQVAESAAKIDRLITEKLRQEKIKPNSSIDNMEFARRIYLDVTGTIPTGRQAVEFTKRAAGRKSAIPEKRAQLIDELLNSPGHVSHSFNFWADILRLRDVASTNNDIRPFSDWVKDSLASDLRYDEFVKEMLSAEGRVWENPPVGYALRDIGMTEANLDNTMRVFLGTRIGCAQCHDHPFDRWTQKEFFHLAAFVHGTDTSANSGVIDAAVQPARDQIANLPQSIEAAERKNMVDRLIAGNQFWVGERASKRLKLPKDYAYDNGKPGQVVKPKVIFGEQPKFGPKQKKRTVFAAWATSPDNERFTVTIANRLWKRVFGVGVIEPVDDMTDETEPSNPELLDFLVSEMKRVNYSQREFLRILYNTKAYQRAAYAKDLVRSEPYHFPGPILRRMTAEQLWDSMLTLTLENPELFERPRGSEELELAAIYPGDSFSLTQLEQKISNRANATGRDSAKSKMMKTHSHEGDLLVRASEMRQPQDPSHFLRQFGQSDRDLIGGGHTEGHVPQILTMFNGPISHKLLYEGTVIYDEIASAGSLDDQVDVIFLSILSRRPTRVDRKIANAEIQGLGAEGVGNVIWALLNTREFMFIQ